MTLRDGVPFGAMFSGLQVSQVSYLWSMEFWGTIASRSLSWRRKATMLALVLLTFSLAAGAGPSSAVLLIPRKDYWSAGSTNIWINGTFDDLWPTE